MKEIRSKVTYATEDGRRFTRQEAAKNHEALVVARNAYEGTKAVLGKLLAEMFQTADGKPFCFGLFATYYWITEGFASLPLLRSVEFWGDNWSWKEPEDESDTLVLISYKGECGNGSDYRREFSVNELYATEETAKAALKVQQRKWLTDHLQELDH